MLYLEALVWFMLNIIYGDLSKSGAVFLIFLDFLKSFKTYLLYIFACNNCQPICAG